MSATPILASPLRRIAWPGVIARAAEIVASYDTPVTLRQLFYRLVAEELLPNSRPAYNHLSKLTAEARRGGSFPALIDRTRSIHRYTTFESPEAAKGWLARIYRRDRTEGQDKALYLGVEKNGIVAQLQAWFGDLGVPILALGGYSSQTYVDEIANDVAMDGRESVLVYAGDFDPSGEDIDRDFLERTGCLDQVVRVALTAEQIHKYDLPEQMGKATDSRAAAFIRRHGKLVQVELDALPPEVLRQLYREALEEYWDEETFKAVLASEREEATRLIEHGDERA